MGKREAGLYKSTEKASMTVSTEPCGFVGATIYASAACTITIVDGATKLCGPVVMSALEHVQIMPCIPIACQGALAVTNSGGGYTTVFYSI